VRLLLDAHISGRRIAEALRAKGHDVRAVDEERALDGWADEKLLSLAAAENRVLVTFNVRDFARLGTEWAEAGGSHAGCALIVGLDHRQFGLVLRLLDAAFRGRPNQDEWRDYLAFIGHGTR
jgi:nucleoside-diphosphate-sugar epimerase